MKIYTAFANTYRTACEEVVGVNRPAAYAYEHQSSPGCNFYPARTFVDSEGNFIKEGDGFPYISNTLPDLSAFFGKELLCINAEFYGPEWHLVQPPMRAVGLNMFRGDTLKAQGALIDKLKSFAFAANNTARTSGLYGFAPFQYIGDERLRVLLEVDAYMPAPYVASLEHPTFESRPMMTNFPKKEVIPVVCGSCVYGSQPAFGADIWSKVWKQCILWGAERVILWADCEAPNSVKKMKMINVSMCQGAEQAGVTLE